METDLKVLLEEWSRTRARSEHPTVAELPVLAVTNQEPEVWRPNPPTDHVENEKTMAITSREHPAFDEAAWNGGV